MRSRSARCTATSVASMVVIGIASVAGAGSYYESVTTSQGEGRRGGDTQKVKAWVEGDKARVEFASGTTEGWFADGNYLVTTDGGDNVYLIDPKEETYAPFNLDEMMATLGQTMNMLEEMGGMVSIEFTDATSEKLLEEPGESILGHQTTHYRYKSGYTMQMNMMGMKRQMRNETVTEIWSTDDLDARGFGVWLKPDRQMKTGNEGLDEMLGQQFGQIKGFPLRMHMEMTTFDGNGKQQGTTRTSTEVTVLRDESVDDSQFSWPEHYTETEVMPDINEAMKNANQGDSRDNKKKKKGGFGGLFGKKGGGG